MRAGARLSGVRADSRTFLPRAGIESGEPTANLNPSGTQGVPGTSRAYTCNLTDGFT